MTVSSVYGRHGNMNDTKQRKPGQLRVAIPMNNTIMNLPIESMPMNSLNIMAQCKCGSLAMRHDINR